MSALAECGRAWLVALALLLPAMSAAVDPAVSWYTVETPSFRVHYHDGPNMHELAQRVARTAEAAHRVLVPLLQWMPERKTEILVVDDVDSANGSATAFLRPTIVVLAEVPDDLSVLNDYEDYLWDLVAHEYTHVLHLDNARGAPAWVNRLFGRVFLPNAYAPRWIIEGLATYQESNVSSAGRNRSALFDMFLRATVVDAKPFGLDETSHYPLRWPRGNVAYLYGGRFLRYVAERVGEERLVRYFASYGSQMMPFALNLTARQTLGVDFDTLYRDWLASLERQYREQIARIEAAGTTPFRLLTATGEGTSQPRFTRDGRRIVYFERSSDRRPAIRSVGIGGEQPALELELESDVVFDLAPDDRRIVYAAASSFRERYYYEDLYEADLQAKATRRLTYGLRATEPAYAPDGKRVAFVGRGGAGWTYLGLLDLESLSVRRLLEAGPDARIFTPRFSPDGDTVYFTQQSGADRHLRALDVQTGQARTIAQGPWMYLEPHPAPDGSVLVTSDRTGVYNLFRVQPETGEATPLTNVVMGAFQPALSPDGQTAAFASYSARGFDVAVMPMSAAFTGELPERAARPERVHVDDPLQTYPVRPYVAVESMWPQYWLPFAGEDVRGLAVGALTSGSDLTDRYRYSLGASWGLSSREGAFGLGFGFETTWPSVGFFASSSIAQSAGFPRGVYDRVYSPSASASFPHTQLDSSMSLSIGYEWRLLLPTAEPWLSPDARFPVLPVAGNAGTLSVSWAFSSVRRYAESISAAEGHFFTLLVRRSGRETLASFDFSSVDARYQGYFTMPYAPLHVLAVRLSGGAAMGDLGGRRVYGLGGIGLNDPLLQLIRGARFGPGHLRGYPPGAFGGSTYALANMEYRFPLATLSRGISSLPFFVRRLHATAFVDAGAIGEGVDLGRALPSLGAELRAELYVAYYLGTELRLGYARGLGTGGIDDLYLTVGSSF